MPSSTNLLKRLATSNAVASVMQDRFFPENVFALRWHDYLFFESHKIFDSSFIAAKDLLLQEGNAGVIALVNLGDAENSAASPRAIFLEQHTSEEEYMSELLGDGSINSWMFWMDRYACAADRGDWSIYCEKHEDLGVFAYHEKFPSSCLSQVKALFEAESIKNASNSDAPLLFDYQKFVPEWRNTLIEEYSSR